MITSNRGIYKHDFYLLTTLTAISGSCNLTLQSNGSTKSIICCFSKRFNILGMTFINTLASAELLSKACSNFVRIFVRIASSSRNSVTFDTAKNAAVYNVKHVHTHCDLHTQQLILFKPPVLDWLYYRTQQTILEVLRNLYTEQASFLK